MLLAQHLISENQPLGKYDVVPGLIPRTAIPPGSTRPKDIACIGDEELIDSRNGVQAIPAAPHLATTFTVKLGNCQLYFPDRRGAEIKMLDAYSMLLELNDRTKANIVSRKLKIGKISISLNESNVQVF